MKLHELAEEIAALESMLDDSDVDDESFRAAIENLNVERAAKAANLGLWVLSMKADEAALDNEIKRLTARRNTLRNRQASVKGYLAAFIDGPVKTPLITISRQRGRESVVITDPDKIPDQYRTPQPDKIDKAAVGVELKSNEVPGAKLERGDDFVRIK